jgi:hypothetical protein
VSVCHAGVIAQNAGVVKAKMAYEKFLSSAEGDLLDQELLDDSDDGSDDNSDLDDRETVHEGNDPSFDFNDLRLSSTFINTG